MLNLGIYSSIIQFYMFYNFLVFEDYKIYSDFQGFYIIEMDTWTKPSP